MSPGTASPSTATQRTVTEHTTLATVSSLNEGCDRCSARAQLRMALPAGGDLVFCGHHANRHVDDILRSAQRVWITDAFEWRGAAHLQR